MWKIQDFSATHILRENNLADFRRSKIAILTILSTLNFDLLGIFCIFQCEHFFQKFKIESLQNGENGSF